MITASKTYESNGPRSGSDGEPDYRGHYKNASIDPMRTSDLIYWSFQVSKAMEYLTSRKVCF